jgi:hypothetical protein
MVPQHPEPFGESPWVPNPFGENAHLPGDRKHRFARGEDAKQQGSFSEYTEQWDDKESDTVRPSPLEWFEGHRPGRPQVSGNDQVRPQSGTNDPFGPESHADGQSAFKGTFDQVRPQPGAHDPVGSEPVGPEGQECSQQGRTDEEIAPQG